jgi:ABC-type nitrate/sulfonate/bicarbonate transport system substrate-binding protein
MKGNNVRLPGRGIIALIVLGVVVACVAAVWWIRLPSAKVYSGPMEKCALGVFPSIFSLFIWVAEDQNYFRKNGLDLTMTEYDSGVSAVKNLLEGKVEIATAADSVMVSNIFDAPDLRILAVIDAVDDIRVIGRKDHGVHQLSDLKGKRIGLMRKSPSEFFLYRLLAMDGIPSQDVEIVDLSPAQQFEGITRGELDAVIVWQPFNHKILKALGANGVSLPGQSKQHFYWLLICKNKLIQTRPEVVRRFLSALLMAENFVIEKETESKRIAGRRLGFDIPYVDSIWKNNQFGVSLPQALILTMEDQARWMMSSGLTKKTEIPDFLDLTHLEALKTLKPEAISIIHGQQTP